MYPDNALPEFYPMWLIREAGDRPLEEIHAFCTPIIKAMGYRDLGRLWCVSQGLLQP